MFDKDGNGFISAAEARSAVLLQPICMLLAVCIEFVIQGDSLHYSLLVSSLHKRGWPCCRWP